MSMIHSPAAAHGVAPQTVQEVDLSEAYEMIEHLENRTEFDNGGTKIVSGVHEKFGKCHIVIGPIGDAIVLPAG